MQHGCMERLNRKRGPQVWQFRWSESSPDGKRLHWQKYQLAEVRTIQVESWLRGLPLAKSSCAKIRNLMSVLLNHACRYELFEPQPNLPCSSERQTPNTTRHSAARRNQGANRWTGTGRTHVSPSCRIHRVAAERDIRLKVGRYRLRARHDERHPFHRVRSGRPVQDRIIAETCAYASDSRGCADAVEETLHLHQFEDWVFASKRYRAEGPTGVRRSCANTYVPERHESESRSDSDGIRSGTPTRLCCDVWGLSSK
jgi:hypothetical protein